MERASSATREGRWLPLLVALLCLTLAALAAQRLWLSPAARERRLAAMRLADLERRSATSGDPMVHHYLALRRLEVGDEEGSIRALETALRLDPKSAQARATLGTILMGREEDERALLHLRQAIQDDPGCADAYLALALLHRKHEAWHLQAKAAEAATRAEPGDADGWILWGEALERQGQYAAAAERFERAAALKGAGGRALASAALARLALGEFDRAEQHARAAVRVAPKDPAGFLALGEVLLKRGGAHGAEAVRAFEQAAALGERTGAAHLGMAQSLQRLRRLPEAEQQFRLALRANPRLNAARYNLVRVLRDQGREEEAQAVEREFRRWARFEARRTALTDGIARDPARADGWFALARLYREMGLTAEARRAALSGLRRAPADPGGLRLLAALDEHASR